MINPERPWGGQPKGPEPIEQGKIEQGEIEQNIENELQKLKEIIDKARKSKWPAGGSEYTTQLSRDFAGVAKKICDELQKVTDEGKKKKYAENLQNILEEAEEAFRWKTVHLEFDRGKQEIRNSLKEILGETQ